MKGYLQKVIQTKTEKVNELRKAIENGKTADEVRALGETLQSVLLELQQAKEQLAKIEESQAEENEPPQEQEGRFLIAQKGGNPLASYSQRGTQPQTQTQSPFATMEYRMAFKDYVQRGTPIPENIIARAGGDSGVTITTDIGAVIPQTIMNELIKEVSKTYGQVYSKVRKLNVKGGVKFPISKLKADFKWVTETTVSEKQKAGDIKDFVEFSYNIGEIRVAQSLLSQVVSLPVFENEIVKIMAEAYVEAMDKGILSGTGAGQLLGITKDSRVKNSIELTETDMADWTAWRKKLFAKVPLSKRGKGEFLFPPSTVESYLLTMKDNNNRPLFREATEGNVGNLAGSFFGRDVTLVEPDVIADFDTAASGDVIGVFWVPSDYAINTNLEFGMKRWFDDDKNEWVNKGLTIADGKILDASGCYLIKKKQS